MLGILSIQVMSETTIKVRKQLKKPIIKWQGWLQSKLGRDMRQGDAAAYACAVVHSIVTEKSWDAELDELISETKVAKRR